MTEVWRLFVAVELAADVREHVLSLQRDLRRRFPERSVRWVRADGVHLTLKFLGDVPAPQVEHLRAALAAGAGQHKSFELETGALGCFPNVRRPRVAWVGVVGDLQALRGLYESVERQVTQLGFAADDRPFNPHLTLGRARPEMTRSDAALLATALESTSAQPSARWRVHDVVLFRSELRPSGAVYTPLCRVPLALPP